MSLDQRKQAMAFVDRTSGGLYGGDNFMGIIDHSMALIARATLESTLAHQRRIRIARTAKLAIGLVELPTLARWSATPRVRGRFILSVGLIQLLKLLARGSLNGTDHLGSQRLNRVQRGVGIN
jgi:hypothetical protein